MKDTFEIVKHEDGRFSIYDWLNYPDDCIMRIEKTDAKEIFDKLSRLLEEEN